MAVQQMLMHFPAVHLPLAHWIDAFVNWLTVRGAKETGFVSKYLGDFLSWLQHRLEQLPWPAVIALVTAAAWRLGGIRLGLGVAAGMLFLGAMGLWNDGMDTLALVVTSTLIAVGIGIPIGILMARSEVARRILNPVLDLMQTMPSFVYLIPALMFFGLGNVPALFATFVYAVPPVIRLTDLGIRQVSREVVEAGWAFGATSSQLLFKVQIPVALKTIMAGVNQTIMMALGMVVVASMIGAGGLGYDVLKGISQLQVGTGFEAGLGIVILAIIIDRITQRTVRSRPVVRSA